MFTQSITEHVVSLVNELGRWGGLKTLPVSFSPLVYHSQVTYFGLKHKPTDGLCFRPKYLAHKVRYKYLVKSN